MFGQYFYNESLRKTIIAFGSLFNDIYITRRNSAGTEVQSMKVPLAYGPKQKFLARLDEEAKLTSAQAKTTALTLPRIGFEMTGLTYDSTRKLNRIQKYKKSKASD